MITCSESSLSSNLHRLQSKHAYAFRQEPYQTLSAASAAFPKRKPPRTTCQSSTQCSSVTFYGVFRSKPQPRRAQSVCKRLPSLFYDYCKLQLCSPPSLVAAPFYMTARAHPAPPSHLHHLQLTHPSHMPQFPSPHPFTATQDAQANPAGGLIICQKISESHRWIPSQFHAGSLH